MEEYAQLVADPAADAATVLAVMKRLREGCREKPVRLLVGNNGGLAVMLAGCERFVSGGGAGGTDAELASASFDALCGLLHEQPDLAGPVQQDCIQTTEGQTAKPTPEITRLCALVRTAAEVGNVTVLASALKACR